MPLVCRAAHKAQENISKIMKIFLPKGVYFDISRIMKIFTDDSLDIAQMASAFAALGSEQRLSVLRALVRAGKDGLSIGELGERTGVTGSTLTHHVKLLAQTGLVEQEKTGRTIRCVVSYARARELSEYLLKECCADSAPTNEEQNHD
jgi:DNA-binding transcriptional ArsR family regulator